MLPWSDTILFLGNDRLGLLKVLLKIFKWREHLIEILRFFAVFDGLDIGVDSCIPVMFDSLIMFPMVEICLPFLLGRPDNPLLVLLVVWEEEGRIDTSGRLLLNLQTNVRILLSVSDVSLPGSLVPSQKKSHLSYQSRSVLRKTWTFWISSTLGLKEVTGADYLNIKLNHLKLRDKMQSITKPNHNCFPKVCRAEVQEQNKNVNL